MADNTCETHLIGCFSPKYMKLCVDPSVYLDTTTELSPASGPRNPEAAGHLNLRIRWPFEKYQTYWNLCCKEPQN